MKRTVSVLLLASAVVSGRAAPAELHIYATGDRGFGLRPSDKPCSTWPQRCGEWMKSQGLLKRIQE
jgi:hypothetical protein